MQATQINPLELPEIPLSEQRLLSAISGVFVLDKQSNQARNGYRARGLLLKSPPCLVSKKQFSFTLIN